MCHRIVVPLALLSLATGLARAQDSISITLGSTNTATPSGSLKLIEQEMGFTTVVKEAGVNARSTTPPADKDGQYLYFQVKPSFIGTPGAVSDLYITVRYFDSGTDTFQVEYDATTGDVDVDDPDADYHRVAGTTGALDVVHKTDTGQWLTHIFHLTDVYFGQRQEGSADFRIDDNADGPETIAGVIVGKTNPIKLNIPQVSTPPTLDGKLDEEYWQTTDNLVELCSGAQDVIRPTVWEGQDDYCARFHYAWDNTALYVAADVIDDVPRNNDQPCGLEYAADGFEVFWGFDQSNPGRKTTINGEDFHWFIKAPPAGMDPSWAYQTGYDESGTNQVLISPNGDCSTGNNVFITDRKDGKSGYIMEVRMPWSEWKSQEGDPHAPPKAGQLIGFTMFGNDGDQEMPAENGNDYDQEIALSWANIPGPSGHPNAWLTIQLGGAPKPAVVRGDLNGNGKVDITDVITGLRAIAGLTPLTPDQEAAGKVTGSATFGLPDLLLILRKVAGLIADFPTPQ